MKEQPYKQELINELPEGEEISFYKQGILLIYVRDHI